MINPIFSLSLYVGSRIVYWGRCEPVCRILCENLSRQNYAHLTKLDAKFQWVFSCLLRLKKTNAQKAREVDDVSRV